MILDIVTADHYLVKPPTYQVTNIGLPRVIVDQLRVAFRDIQALDVQFNSIDKWHERASSETQFFEFKQAALHLATKISDHIKQFRLDPSYGRSQSVLQKIELHLSLKRRWYLWNYYRINLLPGYGEDPDAYDPNKEHDLLNEDWS